MSRLDYTRFSFLFGLKSLQYLCRRTSSQPALVVNWKTFSRCADVEFERGKNRMNMDSNMKLSHLSFRNHCIFRSLNNFSSEGQFLRRINRGAFFFTRRTIFLVFLFSSSPSPPRLFHNYFLDREYLISRHELANSNFASNILSPKFN